jgi:hypothetical protein
MGEAGQPELQNRERPRVAIARAMPEVLQNGRKRLSRSIFCDEPPAIKTSL